MTTRKRLVLGRGWSVAAAGMLMEVFVLAGPAGAQAPPTCGEQPPTMVGTNGADLLVGTPGDDVIVGLGGRDVIVGKGGNDLLCGGRAGDLVSGNAGDDFVAGDDDELLALAEQGLPTGDGGDTIGQAGVDSCVNGEVLQSCEATGATGQPLVAATRARAAIGYGHR